MGMHDAAEFELLGVPGHTDAIFPIDMTRMTHGDNRLCSVSKA